MTNPPTSGPADRADYHPAFLHARREAIVIFFVWLAMLLWAVPFCYFQGYLDHVDPAEVHTVWGIPAWLFWGIGVPWLVADLITVWFCFWFMVDDDLGEAHEDADVEEEVAEMHALAKELGE